MMPTRNDLFYSPDHYFYAFDGDTAVFVSMDRAAYHRSIFLDNRISQAASGTLRVPIAMLTDALHAPAPIGWIFHIAHCGSTLLARALDDFSGNLILREPLTLRQAALAQAPEQLAVAKAMVSKRYRQDAPTIIKANVPVNFALPTLAALDPEARAILLYLPLRDYCLAILRSKGLRTWIRSVTTALAPWLGDLSQTTDAERAAALWLAQMRLFSATAALMPHARSLDAELFYAQPVQAIMSVAEHLGVTFTRPFVEAIVAGPLFSTHSKDPSVRFNNDQRLKRRALMAISLADEIGAAERWVERRAAHADQALAALAAIRLID